MCSVDGPTWALCAPSRSLGGCGQAPSVFLGLRPSPGCPGWFTLAPGLLSAKVVLRPTVLVCLQDTSSPPKPPRGLYTDLATNSGCPPPVTAHATTFPRDLEAFSPCKINIFLRLITKREDGYTNLASLFQVLRVGWGPLSWGRCVGPASTHSLSGF